MQEPTACAGGGRFPRAMHLCKLKAPLGEVDAGAVPAIPPADDCCPRSCSSSYSSTFISNSGSDHSSSDSDFVRHSSPPSVFSRNSFSGVPSCRPSFLPGPLHASSAPSAPPQELNYSSVPAGVEGSSPARHGDTDGAALFPLSSEAELEADAENPLLPGRREKPEDSYEVPCASTGDPYETVPRGGSRRSSPAAGESRESRPFSGKDAAGDPRSSQDPRHIAAAEATLTGNAVSWPLTEDRRVSARLDELSLLSFNAGLLEYKLCGIRVYQNPPFTQRRLHHIPSALLAAGADIVCLQEVYGEAHADFIIESTRHKLPFVGRRTSGGRFSLHNGLMVLSRFPIVHTHFHKFEDVTYIERCFASKGMLEVAIDVPSVGVVAVFNIHLASGAVDPESRYVEDVRAAEIRQLLKACDVAADRGHVPLVIGDLNAAPHLCASNYKCFVERGWRDCWLHVHGHQRHLLQHHLLHQQQLLEEQQLDDQGIELHDRHIRRDLFVRIRRERRMHMSQGLMPVAQEEEQQQQQQHRMTAVPELLLCRRGSLQAAFTSPGSGGSDPDYSDAEKEQQQKLLGQRPLQSPNRTRSSVPAVRCDRESVRGAQARNGANPFEGTRSPATAVAAVGAAAGSDDCGENSTLAAQQLSAEMASSSSQGVRIPPQRFRGRSFHEFGGATEERKDTSSFKAGLLGGYFGRAGGGMQLPFAFELPAAAAWAHREFFLTAKRKLIEQQKKWLGGGDKAPVLDVRLSLAAPQGQQRGVDATPLASDCSLASCSTALTSAQCAGVPLRSAAQRRPGELAAVPPFSRWPAEGAEGSVADWLLSDTDEEMEAREGDHVIIHCGAGAEGEAAAPCSRRDFTWDPENPLNSIGPHAGCHGLRCDYVFLPPHHFAAGLYPFLPVAADILMRDPRVLVDACCFGCFGEVMLVTLSDHYAVRIVLRRSTDADIADFWGSCAAEAAALKTPEKAPWRDSTGDNERGVAAKE